MKYQIKFFLKNLPHYLYRIKTMFGSLLKKEKKVEYPIAPAYMQLPSGEYPIQASYAFYSPFITDEKYAEVKNCGFNVCQQAVTYEELDKQLEFCKKYNLYNRCCTWDIYNIVNYPDKIEKYSNNSNIWGFTMKDEPHASQFDKLGEYNSILCQYTKQNGFFNLFPAISSEQLGSKDYLTHVSDFVKKVNPAYISFDCYPIQETVKKGIYVNDIIWRTLEVIRKVSKDSNRPFWSYILSNKHWSYPKPTEESLRFQAFVNLAYGSQSILYWTYVHPEYNNDYIHPDRDITIDEYSFAPIDKKGNKTDVWYACQKVNNEIQSNKDIFLNCEVINVGHMGVIPKTSNRFKKYPKGIRTIKCYGKEGILISHIKNNNNEYMVIVNKDINDNQKIVIKYDKFTKTETILKPGGYYIINI